MCGYSKELETKIFLYNVDVFKQRLYDNCLQLWNAQLENSTRARTYKLFSCFRYQPYLDIVKITKLRKAFRKAFTRLRVSSHNLEVEAGRWHRPQKISMTKENVDFVIL
jgi:hypothetical protein